MLKRTIGTLLLFYGISSNAQIQDTLSQPKLYIKANALFLPIGVLNAGLEYKLSDKMTLQGDIFISPWKSFAGKYAQIYMVGLDGRYYFNKAFTHWYVGANVSLSRFIIQKYNYWGSGTYQYTPESPIYKLSEIYQDGFSYILGATAGYQYQINDRWNIDFYLGVGTIQSYYKGKVKGQNLRYDTDPTRVYNQSGEWLPYRGGVMISYKLQ